MKVVVMELQQAVRFFPRASAHRHASAPKMQHGHRGRNKTLCVRATLDEEQAGLRRRDILLAGPGLALAATVAAEPARCASGGQEVYSEWEQVQVPVDPGVDLLDVAFVPRQWDRGFLVGTRQTMLESRDEGRSWTRCSIPDGMSQCSFTNVSFQDNDGWVIGRPAVLLHSGDGGDNWSSLPLNLQHSGTPLNIKALGEGRAELITDEGAGYVTDDGGLSWKPTGATSLEAADGSGLSKIDASAYGEYVAVSSQGNSFWTLTRKEPHWQAHENESFSNIRNIGWRSDGSIWLLEHRGGLYMTNGPEELADFHESKLSIQGLGVKAIGFRSQYEAWAAGADGLLLRTLDGGDTWTRDRVASNFSANLTLVRFVTGKGFIMGDGGVLLRHLSYRRRLRYFDIQLLRDMIRESELQKQTQLSYDT